MGDEFEFLIPYLLSSLFLFFPCSLYILFMIVVMKKEYYFQDFAMLYMFWNFILWTVLWLM